MDAFDEWMAGEGGPVTRFEDGAEVVLNCTCPSDCNCRRQDAPFFRPNFCGCRQH